MNIKLDKRKQESIELLLENELTDKEIAKKVGISHRQFCRWKKDAEFLDEWQRRTTQYKISMAKDIERKLMSNAELAVDTLVDLMKNCDNSETKRKIAVEILERIAGKVPNQVETVNISDATKDSDVIKQLYNIANDTAEADKEELMIN